MADRVMKKYKALVEKTIYVAEEVEILAETERQAEEILDNYCVALEDSSDLKVVEVDEQETTVDYWSITSSEELGVDEFMEYRDNLH
tara:strand:- start:942 stop:1202 length:261 start_codon:yes stop_codon:yes gene_type:complete